MLTQFASLLRKHWRLFALQFLWIVGIWLVRDARDWMIDDHVELKLVVVVPNDIPESMPSTTKDGQPITLELRDSYQRYYVSGWGACLTRFLQEEVSHNKLRELTDFENGYIAAGITDCDRQLKTLSKRYGISTVRRILRRKYGSEWKVIEQSVDRLKEAT